MKNLIPLVLLIISITACTGKPVLQVSEKFKTQKIKSLQNQNSRAIANDASDIQLVHFSLDGKYISYFESHTADGSGSAVVTFRILDIQNDKYVINQTLSDGENPEINNLEMYKNLLLTTNSKAIKQYGLVSIKNNEKAYSSVVTEVKLNTRKIPGDSAEEFYYGGAGDFSYKNQTYVYNLNLVSFEHIDNSDVCAMMDSSNPGFSITLNNVEVYKDARVPKSRNCVYNYWINKVIFVKDQPVFFVRYSSAGFEGPDYRTLTVAVKP